MALIGNAKFIILDEPTSNLDLKSREKIWHLIKKISKVENTQRSILISTQHIEEADYMGDRVCILKNGIKMRCDTPENIKRCYGSGFKIKMISDKTRHQQYFKQKENDIKSLFQRKMQDAKVFEVCEESDSDEENPQKKKNIEILIPFKNDKQIPDYLIDFIENDPNFYPEIHSNNLEDAFLSFHSHSTAIFAIEQNGITVDEQIYY